MLADAHASGVTAINITLGYVAGPEEPFEATVRDIATTDRMIRENPRDLMKILSAADIRRAHAEKRIGLLYGFQNCAMMGKDATRVDVFADLGVRVFQLTYNPANQIGDGSMAPENRGITAFGREVIARLNERRVMVDLSHSGQRTCLEAARASRAPISINHTGCRAVTDLPRNKTDEELRLVAEKGGFVGIYFMPFLDRTGHASAADVVAHIDHAVNVCGEDHVGIGTDGTVTQIDDLKAYDVMIAAENAQRRAAGISGRKGCIAPARQRASTATGDGVRRRAAREQTHEPARHGAFGKCYRSGPAREGSGDAGRRCAREGGAEAGARVVRYPYPGGGVDAGLSGAREGKNVGRDERLVRPERAVAALLPVVGRRERMIGAVVKAVLLSGLRRRGRRLCVVVSGVAVVSGLSLRIGARCRVRAERGLRACRRAVDRERVLLHGRPPLRDRRHERRQQDRQQGDPDCDAMLTELAHAWAGGVTT